MLIANEVFEEKSKWRDWVPGSSSDGGQERARRRVWSLSGFGRSGACGGFTVVPVWGFSSLYWTSCSSCRFLFHSDLRLGGVLLFPIDDKESRNKGQDLVSEKKTLPLSSELNVGSRHPWDASLAVCLSARRPSRQTGMDFLSVLEPARPRLRCTRVGSLWGLCPWLAGRSPSRVSPRGLSYAQARPQYLRVRCRLVRTPIWLKRAPPCSPALQIQSHGEGWLGLQHEFQGTLFSPYVQVGPQPHPSMPHSPCNTVLSMSSFPPQAWVAGPPSARSVPCLFILQCSFIGNAQHTFPEWIRKHGWKLRLSSLVTWKVL